MLANIDFVRSNLSAYEEVLFEAVHGGWEDWRDLQLGGRLQFSSRSRACLVYDFSAQRLQASLAGDRSVYPVVRDETVKFVFGGAVILRIKKANDRGLGVNIMTQATMDFIDGQLTIPGVPEIQMVELLYELNELQTRINQVLVTARDGNRRLWSYPVSRGRGVVVAPMLPLQPSDGDRGAKVKVRTVGPLTKRDAGT